MFTAGVVGPRVGGGGGGYATVAVTGFAGATEAADGDLTFAHEPRWIDAVKDRPAGAVLVRAQVEGMNAVQIVVDDPNLAFAVAVEHMTRRAAADPVVHPDATVHGDAEVHASASVAARAVVDAGAVVGRGAVIGAGVYLGRDVRLGEDCLLHPNVTVAHGVVIGDRVIIHSGTVVGSDGYGYATTPEGRHVKIPQTGTVVIEDDVEIGANVCIDRARINETRIGRGTKIDNLVQVGHNVKIGPDCLVVSQAGIAGSSELGRQVVLGGHVGVAGHASIGDQAQVAAYSGVPGDLEGGQAYMGIPAIPISEGRRVRVLQARLPELVKRVRRLERRLEDG